MYLNAIKILHCTALADTIDFGVLGSFQCQGILCILRFQTVWEIIQCWLTSKGYKGFTPSDLRVLYDENTLKGENMRTLL